MPINSAVREQSTGSGAQKITGRSLYATTRRFCNSTAIGTKASHFARKLVGEKALVISGPTLKEMSSDLTKLYNDGFLVPIACPMHEVGDFSKAVLIRNGIQAIVEEDEAILQHFDLEHAHFDKEQKDTTLLGSLNTGFNPQQSSVEELNTENGRTNLQSPLLQQYHLSPLDPQTLEVLGNSHSSPDYPEHIENDSVDNSGNSRYPLWTAESHIMTSSLEPSLSPAGDNTERLHANYPLKVRPATKRCVWSARSGFLFPLETILDENSPDSACGPASISTPLSRDSYLNRHMNSTPSRRNRPRANAISISDKGKSKASDEMVAAWAEEERQKREAEIKEDAQMD